MATFIEDNCFCESECLYVEETTYKWHERRVRHERRVMNGTFIGQRGMYINCKHVYYIFCYLCKLNYEKDTFIYTLTLSWDEVKQEFVATRIIKTFEWASELIDIRLLSSRYMIPIYYIQIPKFQ